MKDKIFLLSVDEYCKYIKKIPECSNWWWLRTTYKPSQWQYAFYVDGKYGYVNYLNVRDLLAVRPALNLNGLSPKSDEFEYLGIKWIKLSNRFAIAKEPIFNSAFHYNEQDYEHSEIRKKLLAWYKERLAH